VVAPLRELETGTTFARRYQVIEELGHGGMGRVYKVFDTEVGEKLALKVLRPEIAGDPGTIERFRNELRLARTVSHRHVCRMHDLGREEGTGTYFITMEYVPGEDLKSLIRSIGALPVGKAVAVGRQVAEGLAEAHRLGVVHRDLKPQNVMIDRQGGARIMDFGIARSVRAKGLTGAGVMIGTPEYMAPEQVDGKEADPRADVYALGVVLFEMLTGRPPFEGETALAVAVKQKSEPAPDPRGSNAQIPEELAKLVLKCLKKERGERYQGAEELAAELARIERTLPETTGALPVRRPQTSKQITVRLPSKKVWIPAAALLAVLAALLVWQFVPERESARRTIAVLGFRNQTGDGGLDYLREAIPNLLITSLEQSKRLRVTSWERLKDLLKQSGRDPASATFDEEAGFEVCRRNGIEALVVGSYIKAGETFTTDVKVYDAATRDSLKSASARGEGIASILKSQIDAISREVGRGIGRPLLKIEAPARPLADLTTGSVEAYDLFLKGRDSALNLLASEAKAYLEKAIALDPTFAIAWLYLADAEYQLVDWRARDEAVKKAMAYSGKASEKERLAIQAEYASVIEKDPAKRLRLLEELTRRYPQEKQAFYELGSAHYVGGRYVEAVRDFEAAVALDPHFGPAFNMLGYAYGRSGEFEKAEAALRRYVEANPGDPNPVDSLAELYLRMGQLDKAEEKYREALGVRPDFTGSCNGLAYIEALRENYAEALGWVKTYVDSSTPTEKMAGLWLVDFYGYLLGRWDASLAGFLSLRKIGESYGQDFVVASVDRFSVYAYADAAKFDEARQAAEAYLAYRERLWPERRDSLAASRAYLMGWIDFKQGRWPSARERLREIESLLPRMEDEGQQEDYAVRRAFLEAEVALAAGSPEEAIAAAAKIPEELFPGVQVTEITPYNIPFIKDVLARAYWKKGDLEEAVAEYRKLMTIDPKNPARYLIHPLYHYRLGRVLEEKGDRSGAAAEYRKFLEYWKDADPSHPEPADARRRLAGL
jgi:serine/threonine protein kinase/Flp pilus assembly protein TadD